MEIILALVQGQFLVIPVLHGLLMALDQLVICLFKVLRHHGVHVGGLVLGLLFLRLVLGFVRSRCAVLAGFGRSSGVPFRRGLLLRLLRFASYRGGLLLLIGRWWISKKTVQGFQQFEVTLGIQGCDNAAVRTAVGVAHILRNVFAGGVIQGVRIFGLQQLLPALFHNFRIASNA